MAVDSRVNSIMVELQRKGTLYAWTQDMLGTFRALAARGIAGLEFEEFGGPRKIAGLYDPPIAKISLASDKEQA